MKTGGLITSLCMLFLMINVAAFSQVYIGDAPEIEEKKQKDKKPAKEKSERHKDKFFHFAYVMSRMEPGTSYEFGPFRPTTASRYGFMAEKGTMRFFSNNFMIRDMANIGVYSSIGLGAQFRDNDLPADFDGIKIPFLFADLKFGPDFRLQITDRIKIDLYGNIGGLINYGGLVLSKDETTIYIPKKPSIGLQTGVGLNMVLSGIVFGAQYTFARGKYTFNVTEDPDRFDSEVPSEEDFEYEVSLNSLRFYIGYYFH